MAFPYSDLTIVIEAYIGADPTADPGTWAAPVDLSSRLLDVPIRITRGRQQGQRTASSGSCTFVLDNDDGALTPLLASSTYYPGWDLGVPVRVSVNGVGASPPYRRFCGFAASIEPTVVPKTGGGSTSAVKVTLGGVIRQRTQGAVAKSPMLRSIAYGNGTPPQAYWSMQDGPVADQFGSDVSGGSPLSVLAADFAAEDSLPGSSALPAFTADTALSGSVSGTFSGGWAVLWYVKFAAAPTSMTTLMDVTSTGGTAARWVLAADSTTVYLTAYDLAGATVYSDSDTVGYSTLFGGQWIQLQIVVTDASSVEADAALITSSTAAVQLIASSGTLVGGNVSAVSIPRSSQLADAAMGHLAVYGGSFPTFAASGPVSAPLAYEGERARARIIRVMAEEGVNRFVPFGNGVLCGPQPIGDVITVLQDTETIDHAMLTELVDDWGLGYVASTNRYNLTAAMTIDLDAYRVSDGDSAQVVVPARNDQRTRNEWTISRPSGSSATVKDTAHQAKHGRYDDQATVNVYTDDDARHEAGWRVREGTIELLRYPGLPNDLAANNGGTDGSAALLAAWLAADLGDRIDRTNHPTPPHPQDDLSFTLEGYTETLSRRGWKVDAVIEPYPLWAVQELADTAPDLATPGRLAGDTRCAIRGALGTGTTSVPFDPNLYRWTTDSNHFNTSNYPAMRLRVAGEVWTASAISTTAATVVAAGAASDANNAAISPSVYASAAADDWVVVVGFKSGNGTLAISDANYTYTQLGRVPSGQLYAWAVRRTSTAAAPTITPTGGAAGDVVIGLQLGLRSMGITLAPDQYLVRPIAGLKNSSAQDMIFPGGPATIYPGVVNLLIAAKSDDWTGVAPPSGFTELVDTFTTTGNDAGLWIGYRIDTSPAAVVGGTLAVTGGASAVSQSLLISLAGGFQTMTVTRSVNDVVKSQAAGALLALDNPLVVAL